MGCNVVILEWIVKSFSCYPSFVNRFPLFSLQTCFRGLLLQFLTIAKGHNCPKLQLNGSQAQWDFSDRLPVSKGQIAPQIICPYFMLLSYSPPEVQNIVLSRGQWGKNMAEVVWLFISPALAKNRPPTSFPRTNESLQRAWLETFATPSALLRPHSDALPQEEIRPLCWTQWCHIDKQSAYHCCLLNVMGCHPWEIPVRAQS